MRGSAALRPIEAICLFTLSTAAPLLPIVRSLVTQGRPAEASRIAVRISAAILLALAPVVTWFLIDPGTPLQLFFGEGRYDGAALVLRILSVTTLTWCFRGVGELVLLSNERARRLLQISGTGGLATVAVGVPLVIGRGAAGAAAATLAAELVMVAMLLRHEPSLGNGPARRAHGPVLAVVVVTAVLVVVLRNSVPTTLVGVGIAQVLAVAGALRIVRNLEQST
jgi:O-antigen/teichoic acid export membrane protein